MFDQFTKFCIYGKEKILIQGFLSISAVQNTGMGFGIMQGNNSAIIFLVLIFIGFMIMFRMQINPQTIISIENALPRIVITMILITFSFPLAGFLIDLLFGSIGFFAYMLTSTYNEVVQQTGGILDRPVEQLSLVEKYMGAGFSDLWPAKGISDANSVGHAFYNVMPNFIKLALDSTVGAGLAYVATKYFSWQLLFLL